MKAFTTFTLLLFFNLQLAAKPEQAEKISVRVMSLFPVEMPELRARSGEDLVPLKFSHIEPSKPVELERFKGGLPIYTGGSVPAGKAPPAHTVKLPGKSKHVLLLAWMENGKTPRFHAFTDDLPTASRKDWMVINSTGNHVAMQIGKGEEPVGVKAGSQETIRVDVPSNTGSAVTIAARLEEAWKPFFTGYWAIYEDKRCLVVIIQNGEKMMVRQIFEDIPKRPEP